MVRCTAAAHRLEGRSAQAQLQSYTEAAGRLHSCQHHRRRDVMRVDGCAAMPASSMQAHLHQLSPAASSSVACSTWLPPPSQSGTQQPPVQPPSSQQPMQQQQQQGAGAGQESAYQRRRHRRDTPASIQPSSPQQPVNAPAMQQEQHRRHRAVGDWSGRQPQQQQRHRQRAQQEGPVGRPRGRDPALITHCITLATCLQHLQQQLQQARHFNAVHVSAMLLQAMELASRDPASWARPTPRWQPQHSHLSNDYSHSSNGSSTNGFSSSNRQRGGVFSTTPPALQSWYHEDRRAGDDWGMAEDDEEYVEDLHSDPHTHAPPPLDHKTRMQALQQLRAVITRTASVAAQLADARQLDDTAASLVLTALAKLGYSKSSGDEQQRVVERILAGCRNRLAKASPRALTNMLWACAMMGVAPSQGWLSQWDRAMSAHLPECLPHQVATCMYALGRLQYKPSAAFLRAACSRFTEQLESSKPRDIANFVAGLAGMGHVPVAGWMDSFLAATTPRLRYFQLSHLHRMLTALASLGVKPDPEWLTAFYTRCQGMLGGDMPQSGMLSTRLMASMTTALSQLNVRPDLRWMEMCLLHARMGFPQARPDELIQLLAALATLRYRPGEGWMQVFLTSSFQQLGKYSGEQVVSLLASLSRLNYPPPIIWQQELVRKVQARLQHYSADLLAELVAGLARLRCRLSPEWLSEWERASQPRMEQFSAAGLTACVWAFAELGHQPALGWLYGYVLAAYSKLDSFDSGQLGIVFGALPRMSHPGWLDELVQICASESTPGGKLLSSSSSSLDELDEAADDEAAYAAVEQYNTSNSRLNSSSNATIGTAQPGSNGTGAVVADPSQDSGREGLQLQPFRSGNSDGAAGQAGLSAEPSGLRIYSLSSDAGQEVGLDAEYLNGAHINSGPPWSGNGTAAAAAAAVVGAAPVSVQPADSSRIIAQPPAGGYTLLHAGARGMPASMHPAERRGAPVPACAATEGGPRPAHGRGSYASPSAGTGVTAATSQMGAGLSSSSGPSVRLKAGPPGSGRLSGGTAQGRGPMGMPWMDM